VEVANNDADCALLNIPMKPNAILIVNSDLIRVALA
jgi:hypothetical protein